MRIRQSFVGADAHIGPLESCEFAIYFRKKGAFCRVDVGIDPYNAYRRCIKNSELHQASREKSRKTKGFYWSVQGGQGGNRNPPGLVFFSQSFLLEKQKKMLDSSC